MAGSRTKRHVGVGVSVALAFLLAACQKGELPFDHVILVTIDTLRVDHLGCYGYPRPVSPFIDSLAERGVLFKRAISSSSHTAPSHASIFTSQYPARHRVLVNGNRLGDGIPTMASAFRDADFETGAVLAVGFLRPVSAGFDQVLFESPGPEGHQTADRIASEAIDWVDRRDRGSRFFLWAHFFDVHNWLGPFASPPEEYRRRLDEDFLVHGAEVRSSWLREEMLPAEVIENPSQLDTYDAQIAFVDAELKRLFEFVEAAEQGSRILWVITADHGEGLGNHDGSGHGRFLYQEQIHVPLILFSAQDWYRGVVVPDLVRHVDLLPTLAELAGLDLDIDTLHLEGQSLVPLLRPGKRGWKQEYAFSQRRPADDPRLSAGWEPGLMLSVQNDRYKFIIKTEGENEVFDLRADPFELDNVAERPPAEALQMATWAARKYDGMIRRPLSSGDVEIEAKYLDELRSLGYLK